MEEYALESQFVGKDIDLKSPEPFITLATKILRDRGEKAIFAGVNPVVRRYLIGARKGNYRTPEEYNQALLDMEEHILYEYFPEELEQRAAEAAREAEPMGVKQAREVALRQALLDKEQNTVEMPKDYRDGGRVRLF